MADPQNLWLSDDPGKAWAERFFLLYTPVWIAAVGLVLATGALKRWDDVDFLIFAVAVSAPLLLIPALRHRRVPALAATPWYASYWFKFNLWIFLFVWVGTYFLTHYFFDVLGMRYAFPTHWNLGAALVGTSGTDIPVFMYPLTQAYFVTYHVVMLVVLRRVHRALSASPGALGDLSGRPGRLALLLLAAGLLAYSVAFAETLFMASDFIRDLFWYVDKPRMLRWGSLFYACYFFVSLPLLYRMDEPPHPQHGPGRAALDALAAGMLVFMILDALTLALGPLVPLRP
jgi:cycloeucalenol cycloisomerase